MATNFQDRVPRMWATQPAVDSHVLKLIRENRCIRGSNSRCMAAEEGANVGNPAAHIR